MIQRLVQDVASQVPTWRDTDYLTLKEARNANPGEYPTFFRRVATTTTSTCDNCGKVYNDDDLATIADYSSRVTPGGIVPTGECPDEDCGALCFPTVTPAPAPAEPAKSETDITNLAFARGLIEQWIGAGTADHDSDLRQAVKLITTVLEEIVAEEKADEVARRG